MCAIKWLPDVYSNSLKCSNLSLSPFIPQQLQSWVIIFCELITPSNSFRIHILIWSIYKNTDYWSLKCNSLGPFCVVKCMDSTSDTSVAFLLIYCMAWGIGHVSSLFFLYLEILGLAWITNILTLWPKSEIISSGCAYVCMWSFCCAAVVLIPC